MRDEGVVYVACHTLLYTADLVNLVKSYDLNPHLYADVQSVSYY